MSLPGIGSVSGIAGSAWDGLRHVGGFAAGVGIESANTWTTIMGGVTSDSPVDPENNRGDQLTPQNTDQRHGADAMRWLLQRVRLEPMGHHVDTVHGHELLASTTAVGTGAPLSLTIDASAPTASWADARRASGAIGVWVDGRRVAVEHVVSERTEPIEVDLGALPAGTHAVEVRALSDSSSAAHPAVQVASVAAHELIGDEAIAARWAPRFERRDLGMPGGNEAARTDAPMVLKARVDHHDDGTTTISYTAFFSDEDAGTPPGLRLARFGRIADVEKAYVVELDAAGNRVSDTYESPGHEQRPWQGSYGYGNRPTLHISTGNNNFSDRPFGTGDVWSPTPDVRAGDELTTMAEHPWTFAQQALEVAREHPFDPQSPASSPELRHQLFVHGHDDLRRAIDAGQQPLLRLRSGATVPLVGHPLQEATGRSAAIALPPGISGSDVVGIVGTTGTAVVLVADYRPRVLQSGPAQ
jgi:hypothetical protein